MLKANLFLIAALLSFHAAAANLTFDFSQFPLGSSPTGFVSTVSGLGEPGDWKIVEDEIPPAIAPLSSNAPRAGKRSVLAQLAVDKTDEHFPLLIFERETFDDFTLTTRFKCVEGESTRMAGIAFRIQDEKNYYVIRASASGNTFRFYKVVNGERTPPIGPQVTIASGVWHEMTVSCKGNQIRCSLNGEELIPALTDNSFSAGRIGFWTKSDSISYFADTRINYTPRVPMAQTIIDDMMQRYPRLVGLKLYAHNSANELRVVASNKQSELREAGGRGEADAIARGTPFLVRSKELISVIMPVKDRNGEPVAALRIQMKPFAGQTEKNALARAIPITKAIEARILTAEDLLR